MSKSRYPINPDRNKPWNDLPLLPLEEHHYLNVAILQKLVDAKSALARLHGRSVVIPNQGLLINTISLQEAKLSSAIEHIFTTDDELYKAYSDELEETNSASKEVLRYREGLWSGFNYLKNSGQFDLNYFLLLLKEIKRLDEGIRPDFVNTTIKQGGTGPNAGQIVYTPPRGAALIQDKLENLIHFINGSESLDPLIKMAIAHYQFEAIHPFRDGNGRIGRVMNIHLLTLNGLLDVPILFMSRYILDHKDDYYKSLQGVSQRGDWTSWILFMLNAVESTANLTFHKINEIVQAKDAILDYITVRTKIRKQESLVEFLFTQPFTKVKHLVDAKLFSENTARDYLNLLSDLKVLEKRELEGKHYYLNTELYRILSE
jgi:Fic family protein